MVRPSGDCSHRANLRSREPPLDRAAPHESISEAVALMSGLDAMPRGQTTVGLESSTSFVRAVRGGTLVGTGEPVDRGCRSQVWQVDVCDEAGKLAATGRARMLCLEPGAVFA